MKTQEIASDLVRTLLRAKSSTEAEAAILAVIAAAEERGRRCGAERIAELEVALREIARTGHPSGTFSQIARAALAPHDPGKEGA